MRVLREDQETEWWRARETDDFNLKKKLLRVGCRPLKRKLLACQKSVEMDLDTFAKCKVRLSFFNSAENTSGARRLLQVLAFPPDVDSVGEAGL